MNQVIAWFARNHVAANLLMALIVVGGLVTLPSIERRVFPEIALDVVSVRVVYPGASPEEIERSVCVRIEESLHGLNGIQSLRSTAAEGVGSVAVELMLGEDVGDRLDQIRTRIEGIDSFPADAERPVVTRADLRFQVITVAVAGEADEWTLKRVAEQVRDEIAALPDVTDVEIAATRPYEIAIEVSEDTLLRHDLTFDEVVRAVQRSSLDLPGGSLDTESGQILLRAKGQAYRSADFARIGLISRPDGTRLTLGDVATITDGFEESDVRARFDGSPAALIHVYRVGHQSALEVSQAVRDYVVAAAPRLPAGIALTPWQDDARLLRDRLATVLGNARSGFILVAAVLACFLRLRLALWVCLGIPISFLGALALMPRWDVHIDLFSLMGFIVVLGIVVDDAIIVGENVHTEQSRQRRRHGEEPAPAGDGLTTAIRGAQGIATPVIFGVLTTIAAFAPMLFVPGPMGNISRVVPCVVILCLVFSLVESLLILPAHLGHGTRSLDASPRRALSRAWRAFQDRVSAGLEGFIERVYLPALDRALAWRSMTLAVGFALFALTLGLLGGGHLRFTFIPESENDTIRASLTLPEGAPVQVTESRLQQIEDALRSVEAEAAAQGLGDDVFTHVQLTVGDQPLAARQASGPAAFLARSGRGSHLGEVSVEVAPRQERRIDVGTLTQRWRERTGEVLGALELTFSSTMVSAGAPIHVQLAGSDLDELRAAASFLQQRLAAYPGVVDLGDSFRGGTREIELEILPSAEALGLTLADLGRQVRQAFHGQEVQRVQRNRDDVAVMVRYPAEERRSIADLEHMRIRTAEGSAVPFSAVARASLGRGFSTIRRVDRQRVVTVTGDLQGENANANELMRAVREEIEPALLRHFPSIRVSYEGEQREQAQVLAALLRGWSVAMLAIYALLAIPLRSYVQPLVIMAAIPFGLIGAAAGHFIMGIAFSMFSVLGLVALSGVVVNDSLVLVSHVNDCRSSGMGVDEAVREAGRARFRAIMLTSLTTFAGLTPLLLETSPQALMLIPMATSLAFGVAFATAITLLLVPVLYLVVEDLVRAEGSEERAEPQTSAPRGFGQPA